VLLRLTEGWYSFGWAALAEPVLRKAADILRTGDLPPREQTTLAAAYAGALAQAQLPTTRGRLEVLFAELQGIRDTYTTSTHFEVSRLDVVEAAVLSAVEAAGRIGPAAIT
jgi:hypothetical protein